jgi:hypothetical protein
MMKKLILLAIITPVAMQPIMKAAVAEVGIIHKLFHPWESPANKSWRYSVDPITKAVIGDEDLKHINFNTFALGFASFFYGIGLEAPWRKSQSRIKSGSHAFISDWLPRILATHEIFKRGTTMAWGKAQHPLSFVVGLTKIFLCFADKLPSDVMKKTFNSKINIEVPQLPHAV